MQNPVENLLLFQARVAASLLIGKILVLGFIWIHYGWLLALVSLAILMVVERLLVQTFYQGWCDEIEEHMREHHDCKENCQHENSPNEESEG